MHRGYSFDDTIVAVATSLGESGIGIVRISGKDALLLADKVFRSKEKKPLSSFKTYTLHYGWVVDGEKTIDEVIVSVMRAPRSYTREDVVEVNCHGGLLAQRAVLEAILAQGARLAEPGEFTKRAFLNGRIDLAQAEAVLDVIRAKTDTALSLGLKQLSGGLSAQINTVRAQLLGALSLLEAHIDFPEEEIDQIILDNLKSQLDLVHAQCRDILEGSRRGRIFKEGIRAVICGLPNVGKSSLLNALLKQERSIVTAVAGTTRDTIEEIIDIKGIPVRIVDTAGLIRPRDLVERKAIQRSKEHIKSATIILLVFDGNKKLTKNELALMRTLKKKAVIPVINKADLKQKMDTSPIEELFGKPVFVSAKKMLRIIELEEAIAARAFKGHLQVPETATVTSLRHIQAIKDVQKLIAEAHNSLDNKLSIEFIAQDIKEAMQVLDGILGKNFSEDLIDKIFSDFCIGK